MPLFQNSVLKKYLKTLNPERVDEAYQHYFQHFHNATIQENIRNAKEEQYQGEFLIDLFVNVLGYTKNPQPDFNLTTELRNVKDAKKADGAIIKGETALAVIELKGTDTTDIGKVENQAFGYKNNQPGCRYVITSNFEKLRFYIDNAVDFEEFQLFELDRERFEVLWLCLSANNLLSDLPSKIKEESLSQEEQITKQLYKDYSAFRTAVFQNITEANPQYDKLLLFKKTQKLLDRFLFIFFAEDRLLLPPNSIRNILQQWLDLKDRYDEYFPLYDRFKKYFSYLNTGHRGKEHDIFAYNGGLFAPDEILNSVSIDDTLLFQHTQNLSNYDFESEVSVNILGHIFEHSLTEIENIQAELEGAEIDRSKTKRKKDGVFYTPKYITKYIVENTVGKLCEEKKAELDITDEAYQPAKQRSRKRLQNLQDYRDWLLQLTICDPACGSGAFLNQALEFLIVEHRYIDELSAKYNKDALVLSDVENSILENNLFGVDINEESVEIAKLSLWLRTAQRGRKLTSLNDNIKCGNSLIDDPEVAGDKAFNWQQEFPKVFEKGGFDVVIGNPPYLRKQGLIENYPELCAFYENIYQSATYNYDIYALFMEKSICLINQIGIVSFILPHKFLITDFGEGIRAFFSQNRAVKSIVHFGSEMVFSDASTYTCIITLDKRNKDKIYFKKIHPLNVNMPFEWNYTRYENLNQDNWDLHDQRILEIIQKLNNQPFKVASIFDKIFVGLQTSLDAVYVFEGTDKGEYIKAYNKKYDYHFQIEKDIVKPFIKGNEISKYGGLKNIHYVLFPYNKDGSGIEEGTLRTKFPRAYKYLKRFEQEIRSRENGKMDVDNGWYLYIYQKNHDKFPFPKIMSQEISFGCNMTYDQEGIFYHPTTIYSFVKKKEIEIDDKFYLGILNSKVLWFFLKNTSSELRGGYYRFKTNYLKPFPLPAIPDNPMTLIEKVENILTLSRECDKVKHKIISHLQSKFEVEKLSRKLHNWHEINFAEFLNELQKYKVVLSLGQEAEWMEYFNEQKERVQALQTQIDRTDREIDRLVYQLYGLTEEEIQIVENS